jgi:TolB protein
MSTLTVTSDRPPAATGDDVLVVTGGKIAGRPMDARFAFESKRNGSYEVYVIDAGGGNERKVTRSGGGAGPAWSPDGRMIAFVRKCNLFVVEPDGRGLRRLAGNGDETGFPGWVPEVR